MSFIINETIISVKKNFKIILLLIILTAVGIFCIFAVGNLSIETDQQVEAYKDVYEDVQFYTLENNFVGERDQELKVTENTAKFRKFMNLLQESVFFEYLMMYLQPVNIVDYKGKENNIYGYEYSSDLSNKTIIYEDADGSTKSKTNVKAFWVSNNVFDFFNIQLKEGTVFRESDFILNPSNPISIILGSNYSDAYHVGDIIDVRFIFAENKAKIIGFLKEGTNVYFKDTFLNLDNYVIMPIFLNDDYEGKEIYNFSVNYFYILRNSGTICSRVAVEDIQKILYNYVLEAGFKQGDEYYIRGYDNTFKVNFDFGIETIHFLISILAILIISAVIILNTVCIINKIDKNKKYYSILMLNGCKRIQICLILLLELLFIFIVSNLLAGSAIIFGGVIKYTSNLFTIIMIETLCFAFLPGIFTLILFFRKDLIFFLQEEI